MVKELAIVNTDELNEYILSHGDLARLSGSGEKRIANLSNFTMDFERGHLDQRRGTYVLYHKGSCCGQSVNRDLLYKQACDYYGCSNLAVFKVPQRGQSIEDVIVSALGDF